MSGCGSDTWDTTALQEAHRCTWSKFFLFFFISFFFFFFFFFIFHVFVNSLLTCVSSLVTSLKLIRYDGMFLAVVSRDRLVYTPRCDHATPFYVRWLHSQEELRVGAICELSTSWNTEMCILCRTATSSGTTIVPSAGSSTSTSTSRPALPHWNLVLVAESVEGNDCPFAGETRKILFAATPQVTPIPTT